jgi:flagellar biosynthetic protein FlhB
MLYFAASFNTTMAGIARQYLSEPLFLKLDPPTATQHFYVLGKTAAGVLVPVMLSLAAAALVFNLMQVGFLTAPEVLQPKLSRLNPLEGAKRIYSIQALVKLGISLLKLIVVCLVAWWFVARTLPLMLSLTGAESGVILHSVQKLTTDLALQLAAVLFALGVVDFWYQRWKHEQDLRMTKQEIREEMKEMEGDPHIRQRRRETHRKLAQARELGRVKEADVIITNPTEIAVALKYDPESMSAPTVVAKGMGEIAARIRKIAAEHRIPIIERKPLARALYRTVKVGQSIPVEMYEVFVEIMAYVYRLSGKKPPKLS